MTFDDLPTVIVGTTATCKFIVAQLSYGGRKKTVLRATDLCKYHAGILNRTLWRKYHTHTCAGNNAPREEYLCEKCDCGCEVRIRCLGGGRIRVDADAKTVHIWDRSGGYGLEPDRETATVAMLRTAYPEYEIACEQPDVW